MSCGTVVRRSERVGLDYPNPVHKNDRDGTYTDGEWSLEASVEGCELASAEKSRYWEVDGGRCGAVAHRQSGAV